MTWKDCLKRLAARLKHEPHLLREYVIIKEYNDLGRACYFDILRSDLKDSDEVIVKDCDLVFKAIGAKR